MAWTHYTTWLDGTKPFTKAQRNELYDAFLERHAVAQSWNQYGIGPTFYGTYEAPTNIRDSVVATDLVKRTFAGTTITHVSLLDAIEEISISYIRPRATSPDYEDRYFHYQDTGDDAGNVLQIAAADLGLTYAQLYAIRDSNVDTHHRWNIARRALMLLDCIPLHVSSVTTYWRASSTYTTPPDPAATWADAKADFLGTSEPSDIGTYIVAELGTNAQSTGYSISSTRADGTITIPALAPFSGGYQLYSFYSTGAPQATGLTLTLDGTPLTLTLNAVGLFQLVFSAQTATGARAATVKLVAHDDSAALNDFEPAISSPQSGWFYWHPHAEPTFTHPAEAVP